MYTRTAIALALLTACGEDLEADPVSTSSGPKVDKVTVVYQSRVDGEIEPCG